MGEGFSSMQLHRNMEGNALMWENGLRSRDVRRPHQLTHQNDQFFKRQQLSWRSGGNPSPPQI